MGERKSRHRLVEALHGDVRLEPYDVGWTGRSALLACLLRPGTREELLPRLERARLLRLREALTVTGIEAIPRGRKSVEHFRQTWICAAAPIAPERWPRRPLPRVSCGFDPEDDDAEDLPAT
jgi:hypothetical protein